MRLSPLVLLFAAGCFGPPSARGVLPENDEPPAPEARPDIAAARELDQEGVRTYTEGRYSDAVRLFRTAFRAGGPPSELWNVARSLERMGDAQGAAHAIQLYLAQAGLAPVDRAEADRELRLLESRGSVLVVATNPEGASLVVDGRAALTTPASLEVRPGTHTLSLHRPGYVDESLSVEARFGRPVVVSLDLRVLGN